MPRSTCSTTPSPTDSTLTVNSGSYVTNGGNGTFSLKNSIIYNVTTPGGTYPANVSVYAAGSSPFASYGGGDNYLASGSTNRDSGTTSGLDSTLAADLKLRTTYAPGDSSPGGVPGTWDYVAVALPGPVLRDTGTPDRGYHYDPIDSLSTAPAIHTGDSVTLPAGYVLAAVSGRALNAAGGSLTMTGTPISRIYVVQASSVVESSVNNPNTSALLKVAVGTTDQPFQARFCTFALQAGTQFFASEPETAPFRLDDCEIYGGGFAEHEGVQTGHSRSLTLRNNLFCRVTCDFDNGGSTGYPGLVSIPITANNNTFEACTLTLKPASPNLWTWRNNLFDLTTITQNGNSILDGYNGYSGYTTPTRISPTSTSDVVQSAAAPFMASTFGSFYLNQTSAFINAGSGSADANGYFFYTTSSSQILEGQSPLDIGYHYIAVSSGVPIVSNGGSGYLNDPTGSYYLNAQSIAAGTGATQGFKVFLTRPVNGQSNP
ncbi:MAG TPA: hypothetical protein VMF06_01810 [Candidatus Limnocylindria bacterium]|nr:hypothetical protein [Candidatus Limnocylindria bacterium]